MKRLKMLICVLVFIMAFNCKSQGDDINPEYFVVTDDYVNLRTEPETNSKVIMILKIPHVIKVLKKVNKVEVINGNRGQWIYADTLREDNKGNTINGWVFDYFLAKKNDFTEIKSLKCNMKASVSFGDFGLKYEFYKNGRFKVISTKKSDSGTIFKYKNLVLLKGDKFNEIPTLDIATIQFLREDGIICFRTADSDMYGNVVCAKCE